MQKTINIINSLVAGLTGAALFFVAALALHWGGLGQQTATVTVPGAQQVSDSPQLASAPVPSGSALSPADIFNRYGDSAVRVWRSAASAAEAAGSADETACGMSSNRPMHDWAQESPSQIVHRQYSDALRDGDAAEMTLCVT